MPQQYDAGQLGIWVFLMTEIMFFGGMIIAYIVYRNAYRSRLQPVAITSILSSVVSIR